MDERQVETWSWHESKAGNANVVMFSSGYGDGFYTSYWGYAADGSLVELVTDFDVLVEAVNETVALDLPLPRGTVKHEALDRHGIVVERPFFSSTTAIFSGETPTEVQLSDGSRIESENRDGKVHYKWKSASPGTKLHVLALIGSKPLDVVP